MNQQVVKSFPINQAIKEVVSLSSASKNNFIYSSKINVPDEVELIGRKALFQELLFKLIGNATKTYQDNLHNKIILITSKIENNKEFSLTVTSGGKGLSFLEKQLIKQNFFVLRDKNQHLNLCEIKRTIKKEFRGYLQIISARNKGTTIKCFFPLNQ